MQVTVCNMIGCKNKVSGSIHLGPGTLLTVCRKHLKELRLELGHDKEK